MIKSSFGFENSTHYFSDDLLLEEGYQAKVREELGLAKAPLFSWAHRGTRFVLSKFNPNHQLEFVSQSFFQILFASFLIPLIFLFFILVNFRKAPLTSLVSLLLLARCMAVFLFAPASHFTYYYSLFLFGFLAFPLFLLELRRNPPKGSAVA